MMQPYPADLRTPHGSTSQLLDEDDESSSSSDTGSPRDAQRAQVSPDEQKGSGNGAAPTTQPEGDDTARQTDQQSAAYGAAPATAANHEIWRHAKQKLGMKTGERFYPNGGGPNYQQSTLASFLALFTMLLYLGWIHVLSALFVASFYSRFVAVLLAGIWATVFMPAKPLLWDAFLAFPMWRLWRNYFNFSLAYDYELDLTQQYILAEVPHGVFPLSQLIAISTVKDTWPGHKVYGIAASSVFNVPLWRHVMTWLGTCPATEHNFRKLLRRGGTVGVVPGGIAEIFMGQDDAEVIKIRDRKGFARMAVEHGVPILPVYHFGNSRLFRWVPKAWEPLSRKWRTALGFMLGRWNLPLPHRVPLFMVVGGPVPVKHVRRGEPGFEAAVDEAHAALCDALGQLYMKYRGVYGWHDRPLIMK